VKKPDALRKWLTVWMPALSADPDQLQLYVENGRIASRRSRNLSFEYRYELKILLTDYVGSPNDLVIPLLAWIEQNEVSLLGGASSDEPFSYIAEILDGDRVDIEITIQLTEPVKATPREDGSGFDLQYAPPPGDDFAGPQSAQWSEVVANLWQGYADTELVAQSIDPAAQPLSDAGPPDA